MIWLLLLSERIRRRLPAGRLQWTDFSHGFLPRLHIDEFGAFLAFFCCFMALMMSGSRAGVLASLATFAVAVTVYFHNVLPKRSGLAAFAVGVAGVALLLVQLLGGSVNRHFDMQSLSDEARLQTYRATLQMIADHPWFGSGLGTFAWSFPATEAPTLPLLAGGTWPIARRLNLPRTSAPRSPRPLAFAGCFLSRFCSAPPDAADARALFRWRHFPSRWLAYSIRWWTSACKYQATQLWPSRWSASA